MKKRKLFSIVLSLCMVLALMPQMVFADEETGTAAETVGKYATNPIGTGKKATITIDGSHSDWSEDMLIAQGAAWDVANRYKGPFESSLTDCYSLYAAWDDDNLYIGWQMVNTTDTWAREGYGPLSDGGRIGDYPMMLALSIAPNSTGMTGRLTNGNKIWDTLDITFTTHTDALLLMSAKVGMGTPALFKAADAEGNTSYDAEYCKYFKDNGIQYAMEEGCLPTNLWMIDPNSQLKTPQEDIYGGTVNYVDVRTTDASGNKQHDTNYDSFYEIKIPFDVLGIDVDYLESNGIGVMQLATKGESAIDCLPHDPSMLDNAMGEYAKDSSTSHEKDDNDNITVPFAIVGGGEKNTVNAPSVSAYATKDQLMGNTFAPNADGTANNIGKLVFGKNSEGSSQEWYILGKDTGVSGDNTIIFAASPIATGQQFNSSTSNKTYNYEAGTGYGDTAGSKAVFANHYGASDLRVALQGMATNTNYFTTAEQGLMNDTTVTTKDTKNSVTYITTDKLYALKGANINDKFLWAGTNDSTVLATNSYWSGGERFWLRSPYDGYSNFAFDACPGKYVSYDEVCDVKAVPAVKPASNLNLSSVLFASAATAASSGTVSGTITSDTAMTLRLDGSSQNIGTVTYNTTTGDIKATKGSTAGNVALVVQGNDGTNDWYYSKQIEGTEILNVSDIEAESNTPASVDLSGCKIWLETTDTDGMIYAVGATETTIIIIHSVAITGIETPAANTTLDTEAACATTGVSSTTPQITWTPSDSTAGYNTSYTASITLTADAGYEFMSSATATVNGEAASVKKNDDGTLTVTCEFPATKAAPGTSDDSNNDNGSKPAADNADKNADTGDSSSLSHWIALMLLAGAGITGAGFYSRRKRTNE